MLQKKPLGTIDLMVSPIGLGTVKFGRNQGVKYPNAFELPTDADIANLLALVKEVGINLIDTAPAYGTSEERLGLLLKGQRADWVIVDKVGEEFINGVSSYHFDAKSIEKSLHRSLKRLNTDYLDVILVHSDGNDIDIIEQYDVFNTLEHFKRKGMIRAYGMSTKTVEGGLKTVEMSDVVMVTFNPEHQAEKPVIQKAYEAKKGVLIKKGLASGHLNKLSDQNPISHAMEVIFSEPGVNSIIIGSINPKHITQNVEAVIQTLSKKGV